MKKLLFITWLLIPFQMLKADEAQKIASKVQKVTVFLNGAQVTRTAQVNVPAGTTTLVFDNLSADIDVQSIQARAAGDFTILSVRHELNYLGEQLKNKQADELRNMQKALRDKISLQTTLLSINQEEANMLAKNQVSNGSTAGLNVLKLKAALDFQTLRLTEIKKKELAINNELELLNAQLQKYDNQINDIMRRRSPATSNVLVDVSSPKAVQSNFTLSYVVRSARWYPSYDIRAKNVNSPVVIAYKANVSQRCGEDWNNVKLTLSTGDPSVSGIKPELEPYYLNIYAEKRVDIGYAVQSVSSLNEVAVGYGTPKTDALSTIPVAVTPNENQTNMEFNIQNPFTVPSDGRQYAVQIDEVTTPANYQYYVAPKLNTDVFLTARITDWTKYNFLSGEANLFFEGTFIGKSVLDTRAANDTLSLSLGVDKNILVKRILQNDLNEKQGVLGTNKKETRDWLITVKNRKTQPVKLLVEDQVPVSQNTAIEVDTQQTSGAELDKLTGKTSWSLVVNSQAEKQLHLKYQVKYPKSQFVIVR